MSKNNYNSKIPAVITFSVFVIFTLLFGLVLLYLSYFEAEITDLVGSYGYVAIFASSFILDMVMQPLAPDLPIAVGIVGNLNPWMVLIFALFGSYAASILGYYLGEKYGEAGFKKWYGEAKFDKLVKKYYARTKWIVAIGALTPVPYVPVCWIAGIFKMEKRHFYIYALVTRTIRLSLVAIFFAI